MSRVKVTDVIKEDGGSVYLCIGQVGLRIQDGVHVGYQPYEQSPVMVIVAEQLVTIWQELNGKTLWSENETEGHVFVVTD